MVDLPAPLPPMTPTIAPRGIENETFSNKDPVISEVTNVAKYTSSNNQLSITETLSGQFGTDATKPETGVGCCVAPVAASTCPPSVRPRMWARGGYRWEYFRRTRDWSGSPTVMRAVGPLSARPRMRAPNGYGGSDRYEPYHGPGPPETGH